MPGPVLPSSPPTSLPPVKAVDLIRSALFEINIVGAGETPSGDDGAWGLEKLQRIVDKWNAIRQVIYAVSFTLFNLIPNHAPHTIGPLGDFDTTPAPRPVKIVSSAFVLSPGSSNPVDMTGMRVVDEQWWADQPLKSLTSSICTHLYYDPGEPLGNCNFWPICNTSNPVRLETWTSLIVPLTQTTLLTFPQGYWDAMVLSLAVEMCSAYEKEPSPTLAKRQNDAMKIIMANNAHPPRIRTDDSMPASTSSGRPDFNFLTGLRE